MPASRVLAGASPLATPARALQPDGHLHLTRPSTGFRKVTGFAKGSAHPCGPGIRAEGAGEARRSASQPENRHTRA
jgi:hypothetical protein